MKTKLMKKDRVRIGIGLIILTLAVFAVALPHIINSQIDTTDIVVVAQKINKGDKIKEENLTKRQVLKKNVSDEAILDTKDAVGKYALNDIYKDKSILKSEVSDTFFEEFTYLTNLDGNKKAISFSLSTKSRGLAEKLETNDIISIMSSVAGQRAVLPESLQYVPVVSTTLGTGDEEQTEVTITVLANDLQAEEIATIEAEGAIYLALVYRGNEEMCKSYIEKQDKINQELMGNQEQVNNQDNEQINEESKERGFDE